MIFQIILLLPISSVFSAIIDRGNELTSKVEFRVTPMRNKRDLKGSVSGYKVELDAFDQTHVLKLRSLQEPIFTHHFEVDSVNVDSDGQTVFERKTPSKRQLEEIEQNIYTDENARAVLHLRNVNGRYQMIGSVGNMRIKRNDENEDDEIKKEHEAVMPQMEPPNLDGDTVDPKRPYATPRGLSNDPISVRPEVALMLDYTNCAENWHNESLMSLKAAIYVSFINVNYLTRSTLDLKFRLSGIYTMKSLDAQPFIEKTIVAGPKGGRKIANQSILLGSLREWANENIKDKDKHDVIALLHGDPNGGISAGLAFVHGACSGNKYSVSGGKLNWLSQAGVEIMSHEIGHNLGQADENGRVHPYLPCNKNNRGWGSYSGCNAELVKEFYQSTGGHCLRQTNNPNIEPDNSGVKEGIYKMFEKLYQGLTLDDFCKNQTTNNRSHLGWTEEPYNCEFVQCGLPGTSHQSFYTPENTPCGDKGRCKRGKCVDCPGCDWTKNDPMIRNQGVWNGTLEDYCKHKGEEALIELPTVYDLSRPHDCVKVNCITWMKNGYGHPTSYSTPVNSSCRTNGRCVSGKCLGCKGCDSLQKDKVTKGAITWNGSLEEYCRDRTGDNLTFYDDKKPHDCKKIYCITKIRRGYGFSLPTPSNTPCGTKGRCYNEECVDCVGCEWDKDVIWDGTLDDYCKDKTKDKEVTYNDHNCKAVHCIKWKKDGNSTSTIFKTPSNTPCGTKGRCQNEVCVDCKGCDWDKNDSMITNPFIWNGTLDDYCKNQTGVIDTYYNGNVPFDCHIVNCGTPRRPTKEGRLQSRLMRKSFRTPTNFPCGTKGRCHNRKCRNCDGCDWIKNDNRIVNPVIWNGTLDDYCKNQTKDKEALYDNKRTSDCIYVHCITWKNGSPQNSLFKTPSNSPCGTKGRCQNEVCVDCAGCDWDKNDPMITNPTMWNGNLDDYCKNQTGEQDSIYRESVSYDCKRVYCTTGKNPKRGNNFRTPVDFPCGDKGRCYNEKCLDCDGCDWVKNDNRIKSRVFLNGTLDDYCKNQTKDKTSLYYDDKPHDCKKVHCLTLKNGVRVGSSFKTPSNSPCNTTGRCVNEICVDCKGCDWVKNDPGIKNVMIWNSSLDDYCSHKVGKDNIFYQQSKPHDCKKVNCHSVGGSGTSFRTPSNFPCGTKGRCYNEQCLDCDGCDWINNDNQILRQVIWNGSLDDFCKSQTKDKTALYYDDKPHDCKKVHCLIWKNGVRQGSSFKTPSNSPCNTTGRCVNEVCMDCKGCDWIKNDPGIRNEMIWNASLDDYCSHKVGGKDETFYEQNKPYDCKRVNCYSRKKSGGYGSTFRTPSNFPCGTKGRCYNEQCLDCDGCDWINNDNQILRQVIWNGSLDDYCTSQTKDKTSLYYDEKPHDCKKTHCLTWKNGVRQGSSFKTPSNSPCNTTGRCVNEVCINCAGCDWDKNDPGIKNPVKWNGTLDDYCKRETGEKTSVCRDSRPHDCKFVYCVVSKNAKRGSAFRAPENFPCGTKGRCYNEKCLDCDGCDWVKNDNQIKNRVVSHGSLDDYCKIQTKDKEELYYDEKPHDCKKTHCITWKNGVRQGSSFDTPSNSSCGTKGRCVNEVCIDCDGCDWDKNDPGIKNPVIWNGTLDDYCKSATGEKDSIYKDAKPHDCKFVYCVVSKTPKRGSAFRTPANFPCGTNGRCFNEKCIDCAGCDWVKNYNQIKNQVMWNGTLDDYCKRETKDKEAIYKDKPPHDCKKINCVVTKNKKNIVSSFKAPANVPCGTKGTCVNEKCLE